jgi:exopolysaccharide biosynthesis protein
MPSLLVLTTILGMVLSADVALSIERPWKKVDEGLHIGEFVPPEVSKTENSRITIVKITPRLYSFKLLCASEHGKTKMTMKQWCQKHNLIAAINAGVYQEDGIRNVGYMKNFGHINNPRLNKTYKAVLAFNPIESTLPEIQIIDLKYQEFEKLKDKYETLIQNIRMISPRQENVWRKQDKAWGQAVFGMDKSGNAILIFTESCYSGYEFANILLSLPISIYNAMYLEGGQEANIYFSRNGIEFEKIGRPTSITENDS